VEAVRRYLGEQVGAVPIVRVEIVAPRVLRGTPRADVVDAFLNRSLSRVERHGRTLLLRTEEAVLALDGRPGAWVCAGGDGVESPPGVCLTLHFGSGHRLWYADAGAGARAAMCGARDEARLASVLVPGVDPLSAAFTLGNFKRILTRKKRTTRLLLVDDELIAGIGGLYADEILYVARVRPSRVIPSLKVDEVRLLYYSVMEVLQKATRFAGVSSEGTPLLEGQPGTFARYLLVHGRADGECVSCKAKIRVAASGKTRACYCPRCQR